MSLPGLYLSGNKRYKKTSNSSLDGFTPLSMLDTELGVETELDTLERFTNEKGRQLHVVSGLYRVVWWSWGDLNPRPQALFGQIYMFSGLI